MTDKSPFENSSIFITGGAGFLGRGLLRYFRENKITPAHVTVYSRDEQKHHKLRSMFPQVRTVLGDIRDVDRLAACMTGHDVVIHMAAAKHVPEAERDVSFAYEINVTGSRAVALAAMRANVQQVIGISTDKVTSPRNVYGATKMLMERTFQEAQRMAPHIRFSNVRYGNVISSTGSVIPMFREQFETLGRANITSLEMTRFWVGVDDAVRLIEYALSARHRGHTYILKCDALSILDVAQAAWNIYNRLGGPEVVSVPHTVIGTRPGEKIHECLLDSYEAPYATEDVEYLILPPSLSMVGEGLFQHPMAYSSDAAHKLTVDEMVALIQDSEKV